MTAAETTHTGDIESVTVQFTPSATSTNANLQCRMYAGRFPEVDSIVMVNVQQIAEIGAYVSLLEYNGIEGMIQLSEFSRRRIRSLQKLGPYLFNAVRVGRNEVVVVMRVDAEKGYIDLSKRRASPEDVLSCEERYLKSKAVKSALSRFCDKITKVHSIMRQCAEVLGENLESLYERFGWPLYKTYGHALDAFKIAVTEPDRVFSNLNMPPRIQKELVKHIRQRLTPHPIKIRADIECTCFGYEGIDAIKLALAAGEACSTESAQIKIKLVAPPLYVMFTNSTDKVDGINVMELAIAKIEEVIKSKHGGLSVTMKPRAVSENDDAELKNLMDKLAVENVEVAGDESDDGLEDE